MKARTRRRCSLSAGFRRRSSEFIIGRPAWPHETILLSASEPSSVVTKKPIARSPKARETNFGTAAGSCAPRISPSIQPRHCTVECGNLVEQDRCLAQHGLVLEPGKSEQRAVDVE